MEKVRWGIISTAKIGREKVISAMQESRHCRVEAIASQSIEKAQTAAEQLGIPKAYGSYEALLADPDIDAVYLPLPNHMHVLWSIKAIRAGKHVLCEKPIGLTSAEAQSLLEVSLQHPEIKVMEGFMYRFHPQWQKARELVIGGGIGSLQTIQSFFSYHNVDPANIRNKADAGGGGLMDIGCYNLSLSRYIFAAEPDRVFAVMQYDDTFKVDYLASGILDFGGRTSTFTCSTQVAPYQRVNIFGTEGRIEIEIPFNAPADQSCRMWHQQGKEVQELTFGPCNQYTLQADAFARAVLKQEAVPTDLQDAVSNMQVIEKMFSSAKLQAWV